MRHNKLHTLLHTVSNHTVSNTNYDSNSAVKPLAHYLTSSELHKYDMVSLLA